MTRDDAAAVAMLCHQLGYRAAPAQVAERVTRLLESLHDALFVAEHDGTVLAWIHVRAAVTLTSEPHAEVVGLVVSESERHRGVGSALMRHAEAWAMRSAGLTAMRVRSAVSRGDAHGFYHACGYHAVKRQEVFDKPLGSAD